MTKEEIYQALQSITLEGWGKDLVTLGLIYGVYLCGKAVHVQVTFPSSNFPHQEEIVQKMKTVLKNMGLDSVKISIVWDPPWNERMIHETIS